MLSNINGKDYKTENQTSSATGDRKWFLKRRYKSCSAFCFPELCVHIGKANACPIYRKNKWKGGKYLL